MKNFFTILTLNLTPKFFLVSELKKYLSIDNKAKQLKYLNHTKIQYLSKKCDLKPILNDSLLSSIDENNFELSQALMNLGANINDKPLVVLKKLFNKLSVSEIEMKVFLDKLIHFGLNITTEFMFHDKKTCLFEKLLLGSKVEKEFDKTPNYIVLKNILSQNTLILSEYQKVKLLEKAMYTKNEEFLLLCLEPKLKISKIAIECAIKNVTAKENTSIFGLEKHNLNLILVLMEKKKLEEKFQTSHLTKPKTQKQKI